MAKLKPCPFCGCEIFLVDRTEAISFIDMAWQCSGCSMEFAYRQDFVHSQKAKIATNSSFEEVWNRRAADVQD